ncbi:MAG: tRNA-intron lyase [Thermoplasmata archaeon]
MGTPVGKLGEEGAVVEDPSFASRVYNKGWFGTPLPGGGLSLELVEAMYLLETGRLELSRDGERVDLEFLFRHAVSREPAFETRYPVYADLRRRGLTVKPFRPSPPDFVCYERGAVPSRSGPRYHVLAISERAPFKLDSINQLVQRASSVGRGLLVALVDEEGDVTYYEACLHQPSGELGECSCPERGKALVLDERVLVFDRQLADALKENHFGRPAGRAHQLSLIEAAHLLEKGLIELFRADGGKKVGKAELRRMARRRQKDFELRFRVYTTLRKQGLLPRTGFKYGTHFRVYERDPDGTHARYLIHCFPAGYVGTWPEISRAVRVAHGVKKEILFARVGSGSELDYVLLKRVRP